MPRGFSSFQRMTREEFEMLVAAARRPGKVGRPISDRSAAMARAVLVDGLTITQAALAHEGGASTALQAVSLLLRYQAQATDLSAQRSRDERLAGIRSKVVDAGLRLLDTDWHGQHHRNRLRCGQGHEWERGGQQLLRAAQIACERCRGAGVMHRMRNIAEQSGGECSTARRAQTAHR